MSTNWVNTVQFRHNVILVTVIVLSILVCGRSSAAGDLLFNDDYDLNYGNKDVNDRCQTKTKMPGICKLVLDCPEVLQMIMRRRRDYVSCGFQGDREIVCCPLDPTTITTTTTTTIRPPPITTERIVANDHDCINQMTGEKGYIKFSRYCPELGGVLPDSIDANLCSNENYDLCYDVVCCPIRHSTRLTHKCRYYDDPDNEIKLRANLNFECQTPASDGMKAFYSTECQLTDLPKVIISSESKVQPQCCPIASIEKLVAWDSPDFKFVKVIGRNCTSMQNQNARGVCRPHNQCPSGRVVDPDSCYINRETQFVCCENEVLRGFKTFEQACYNYSQEVYSEVYRLEVEPIEFRTRIGMGNQRSLIQGIISKPTEYPHMVALGYITSAGNVEFSCSGSLISENFVLTVAQCLQIYDLSTGTLIPVIKVRTGITTLNMSLKSNDCPEDYNVDELIPHPKFSREAYYDDIGLIKLLQSVRFNAYIRPICLPSTDLIPSEVIALGYGAISDVNPTNDKLVKILLDTYTKEECQMYFVRPFKKLNRGINAHTQVCAGSRSLLLNACPADAGGSIITTHPDFYETSILVGLTVYNKMCGFINNPGIYMMVHPYRDWIESIVWSNSQ